MEEEKFRRRLRRKCATHPIARWALLPWRARTAFSYYRAPLARILPWLVQSSELDNFTYGITERSRGQIAGAVGVVCRIGLDQALAHIAEAERDVALSEHIGTAVERLRLPRAAAGGGWFGRRLGWYAMVRARKPRLVVETGVHHGIGACLIAAALARNQAEGHPGRYLGTDINPRAGAIFLPPYKQFGEVRYGDSIETLNRLEDTIDLFIHDSDHEEVYELRELRAASRRLAEDALVLSDNAHDSDALMQFARETGRNFLFVPEGPKAHWYPGAGIGIAFR